MFHIIKYYVTETSHWKQLSHKPGAVYPADVAFKKVGQLL